MTGERTKKVRMLTLASLLAVGVVAGCSRDSDNRVATTGQISAAGPATAGESCDGHTAMEFAKKIKYLRPDFDLENNGFSWPGNVGNYSGPMPDLIAGPVDPNIIRDITRSYSIAPCFLKARLDELTYLFIDRGPRVGGWGFFERNDAGFEQGNKAGNFIGLSVSLFAKSDLTLTEAENQITQLLLYSQSNRSPPRPWPTGDWPTAPNYLSADADGFPHALLAIIAHEMGHIIFQSGRTVATWDCKVGNEGWFSHTWGFKKSGFPLGPRSEHRFHGFGRPIPNTGTNIEDEDNGSTPGAGDLVQSIAKFVDLGLVKKPQNTPTGFSKADKKLRRVYGLKTTKKVTIQDPDWASLFARVSADEDFAETFSLVMLSKATPPLTSLKVRLQNEEIDLVAKGLNNSTPIGNKVNRLYKKGQCIVNNLGIR